MHNNFNESHILGNQDFPADTWIQPGYKVYADHAEYIMDFIMPQPPASINGVDLHLPPNVYHPGVGLSSHFLAESLTGRPLGVSVLDLGCGSGFLGISLYRPEMDLVLADISGVALVSASENLRRLGIPAQVVWSDLFSGLKGRRFDAIVFDLPLFDKVIEHEVEIVLCDPNGELLRRFLAEAPRYLTSNGKIYFTASNVMNRRALLNGLKTYNYETLASATCTRSGVLHWAVCASPDAALAAYYDWAAHAAS